MSLSSMLSEAPTPPEKKEPQPEQKGSILAALNETDSRGKLTTSLLEKPLTGSALAATSSSDTPKTRYKYKGTSIKTKDLLEDKDNLYSDTAKYVFDVAKNLHKMISDKNLSSSVAHARTHQDAKADETRKKVLDLATAYLTGATEFMGAIRNRELMAEMLVNEICGYGAITPLYQDPDLSEIMVNSPYETFIELHGDLVPVPGCQYSNREHLIEAISSIAQTVDRVFDSKNAVANFMLADLSRVNAIHPSISVLGPNMSIRKHKKENFSIKQLMDFGSMPPDMVRDISQYFSSGMNIIVAGVTGSGKTTLLTAALKMIPRRKRVITIEGTLELELDQENIVVLQSRPDGKAPVTEADLIGACLRLRPDAIVVGEVRFASELTAALNAAQTGHQTVFSIHANDPATTATRCMQLLTESGAMTEKGAALAFSSAIDIVIVQTRFFEDNSRKVNYVYEVLRQPKEEDGVTKVQFNPIWEYRPKEVVEQNGKPLLKGDYVRVGDITQDLRAMYRVFEQPPTLEEVYKESERRIPSSYERYEEKAGGWND